MNTETYCIHLATREKIEIAFIAQVRSKRLLDISVTDICKIAKINRSSFYKNYKDVFALATEISRRIEKTIAEVPHSECDYTWLFEYVAVHRVMFISKLVYCLNRPIIKRHI